MKEKKKLSLPAWIFIGMLAGIAAGLIFAFAGLGDFTTEWIKPIGTIYVNLLKFLVVPVVLFSIADGVISLKDLKRVGSVGVKTFVYYMCTTALAVVIGLVLIGKAMQDDLFYFAAAACFAVLLAAATFGFAPPAPLEVIEISPSPFTPRGMF